MCVRVYGKQEVGRKGRVVGKTVSICELNFMSIPLFIEMTLLVTGIMTYYWPKL